MFGGGWPEVMTLSPDGSRAYVAVGAAGRDTLFAIDVASSAVIGEMPRSRGAVDLVMSPDGRQLYVTGGNGVEVIDTAAMAVTATVAFPPGVETGKAAMAPDGAHLYVAATNLHAVGVVDTATNALATLIPVPLMPTGVAVAPDGHTVYVGGRYVTLFGSLTVLDADPPRVRATVALERPVVEVALTPDGTFAYLTNGEAGTVTVVETRTNQLVAVVPVGGAAGAIALATMPNGCATAPECAGDCNSDQQVAVDEIVRVVLLALGQLDAHSCPSADANGDGPVNVSDAILAVRATLEGCAGE
jgi:YVTN family beta-propeller protein